MSQIVAVFKELQSISAETKRLQEAHRGLMKPLRARHRELEEILENYLRQNQQTGVQVGNTTILLKEKEVHKAARKKEEKYKLGEQVLAEHGVEDPRTVIDAIFNALKGPVVGKVGLLRMKQDRPQIEYKKL